ncbi:hypothetical protein V5799_027361, partial [Amblyomma americanum]
MFAGLALRVPAQRLVEGSSIAGLSLNGGSGVPVTSSVGTVGTAEAAAVEHQAADTSTPETSAFCPAAAAPWLVGGGRHTTTAPGRAPAPLVKGACLAGRMAEAGPSSCHRCPLCPFATESVADFCKH